MQPPIISNNSHSYHPVHDVYDGVFNTATGQQVSLLHPSPEQISLEDIAKALSKLCRFGGQLNSFYSVAQHSVLVCQLAPAELRAYALMHDATEAYVGDVIKPLKVVIGDVYRQVEERFHRAICERFGFDAGAKEWEAVKRYDIDALTLEHYWLQQGETAQDAWQRAYTWHPMQRGSSLAPPSALSYCWDSLEAEVKFKQLASYYSIV